MPAAASALDPAIAARLKRDADGLVAAVAQQYDTGEVLMLGWMDDEALHRTLTTGRCTYWSRSRQEYWVKGDTSGHVQHVQVGRASTATATPCWSRSTRSARPATPATAPASTPARCSPPTDGRPRTDRRDHDRIGTVTARSRDVPRAGRATAGSSRSPAGCWPTARRRSALYRKLAGERPGTFLLESAEHGRVWSRYSFVGVRCRARR